MTLSGSQEYNTGFFGGKADSSVSRKNKKIYIASSAQVNFSIPYFGAAYTGVVTKAVA